jgi:hypothetical protein
MDRIKTATPSSPIAVFKCSAPGMLNAVFGATVISQSKIRTDRDLIGVYDGLMDRQVVLDHLRKFVGRAA